MFKTWILRPLSAKSEAGASGLLMSIGVATVALLIVQGMQTDTHQAIEFNARLKAQGELRRANQNALETISQMLTSGAVTVPMPNNRSYTSKKTTDREASDVSELNTGWVMAHGASREAVFVDPLNPRRLRFVNCGANKLSKEDLKLLYESKSEFACDRLTFTDVTLGEVRVVQHRRGHFASKDEAAQVRKLMQEGQFASPLETTVTESKTVREATKTCVKKKRGKCKKWVTRYTDRITQTQVPVAVGWEVLGLVRRNLTVSAVSRYDRRNIFSMGTAGSAGATRSGEIETRAVLSVTSDVHSHKCRWEDPNWQEPVKLIPPIAGGGWGPPLMTRISRDKSFSSNAQCTGEISMTSGISCQGECSYWPDPNAKKMTGQVGGMHQHGAEVEGWGAKVCGYGTMFYIEKPDQVDCRLALVPLREEKNYVGGCFAPGTPIRMADGTDKSIDAIAVGDLVYNPMKKAAQRVASVRKGYEGKSLIELGYGGRVIAVTENHPFVSEGNQLRQARHLVKGDRILAADGSYQVISHLRQLPPEPYAWVHNLSLDSDAGDPSEHMVLANGIMTGDHYLQTQLEAKLFAETGRIVNAAEVKQPSLSSLVAPATE